MDAQPRFVFVFGKGPRVPVGAPAVLLGSSLFITLLWQFGGGCHHSSTSGFPMLIGLLELSLMVPSSWGNKLLWRVLWQQSHIHTHTETARTQTRRLVYDFSLLRDQTA